MKNIGIIIQQLNDGGAERMAANLSIELQKYYNVFLFVFDTNDCVYPYAGTLVDVNLPPQKNSTIISRLHRFIKRIIFIRNAKKKYNLYCTISNMEVANLVNIFARYNDKIISVYHTVVTEKFKTTPIVVHKLISKLSDKYVQVSELSRYNLVHRYKLGNEKILCIHNFADISNIHNLSLKGIEDNIAERFFENHDFVFISMGRLTAVKAQKSLLKAFYRLNKSHPKTGLIILGEGEKRSTLEKTIRQLGLAKNVYLPGDIKNPFPYIRRADVFVFTSFQEGLPMVLIEAAACGIAMISTDMQSGAREILAPDTPITTEANDIEFAKYGILVPVTYQAESESDDLSPNELKLCYAMQLLYCDDALRNEYSSNSKNCADYYSSRFLVKEWIKIIEN